MNHNMGYYQENIKRLMSAAWSLEHMTTIWAYDHKPDGVLNDIFLKHVPEYIHDDVEQVKDAAGRVMYTIWLYQPEQIDRADWLLETAN